MEKKGKPVNNEVSHLLNKIVELEKQNEALKKENSDLKSRLTQAEAKIKTLQSPPPSTSPSNSTIEQTKNQALEALDNLDKEINQLQKRSSVNSDSELMLKVLGGFSHFPPIYIY